MAGLGSGSPELVHGTMRVLVEFCQDVADTQMPQVAPVYTTTATQCHQSATGE